MKKEMSSITYLELVLSVLLLSAAAQGAAENPLDAVLLLAVACCIRAVCPPKESRLAVDVLQNALGKRIARKKLHTAAVEKYNVLKNEKSKKMETRREAMTKLGDSYKYGPSPYGGWSPERAEALMYAEARRHRYQRTKDMADTAIKSIEKRMRLLGRFIKC